jgi:hypothetical protein
MSLEQPRIEDKKTPEELKSPQETVLEKNKITDDMELGGGINKTIFVEIKDDGDGVFKPGSKERGGTPEIGSGYKRERAAYLIDMFLGFDLVPPTVIRTIDGEEGSLQQFIPDGKTGNELTEEEKKANKTLRRQASTIMLFDLLINNCDRHSGNYIVDKNGKLWGDDNGDSLSRGDNLERGNDGIFGEKAEGYEYDDESIQKVKNLSEDEVKKKVLFNLLRELIGKKEVVLFFKRLELISEGIHDNRLSGLTLDFIGNSLETFSAEYDNAIRAFITNSAAQGLTQEDIINKLFEEGQAWAIDENLELFDKLDKAVAIRLIEAHRGDAVMWNHEKFEGLVLDKELAMKLIGLGNAYSVTDYIKKFEGLDKEVALKLIEAERGGSVVRDHEKFEGLVLDKEIAMKLIECEQKVMLLAHLKKFNNLDGEIAGILIERGAGEKVVRNHEKFEGLVLDKEIAMKLIETDQAHAVAYYLDKFQGLDKEIKDELERQGFNCEDGYFKN